MTNFSRRSLLGALGASAGAVALDPRRVVALPPHARTSLPHGSRPVPADHFGRIFTDLPPFADETPEVASALREIGRPGGLLDAADELDAGPEALIADLALSEHNPNNPGTHAGFTFLGQYIDHDITFDTTSRLGRAMALGESRNSRTPSLDLDSVYGAGPVADQRLYDPSRRVTFRVESGGLYEDLPRTAAGDAIIADPRNDENVMIAGLQAAFLLFHNRAVDHVRSARRTAEPSDLFAAARRLVTWHYHWIVLHEFLPTLVGQDVVDDLLGGGQRHFRVAAGEGFIPIEFQIAYRVGHSMVRPSYRANLAGDAGGRPFFGLVFDPGQDGADDPDDLRGGTRAPRRFVGWQTFFDFGDEEVKPSKLIDTKISTPLFNLPLGAIASHDLPTSLPERNLLRHLTWQVPSGQRIAAAMGVPALGAGDLGELAGFGVGFETSTPLWYYVLKEAEVVEGGARLGPVGGRIVGEVLLGLLESDPASYLSVEPGWRPTLPSADDGFAMTDLLTFAGVDPASRGQ